MWLVVPHNSRPSQSLSPPPPSQFTSKPVFNPPHPHPHPQRSQKETVHIVLWTFPFLVTNAFPLRSLTHSLLVLIDLTAPERGCTETWTLFPRCPTLHICRCRCCCCCCYCCCCRRNRWWRQAGTFAGILPRIQNCCRCGRSPHRRTRCRSCWWSRSSSAW